MKKTFVFAFVSLLAPIAVFASTITLAPTSVSTVAGKSFSVTVGVNPTSGKAYTVRANLSFDPSVMTLTSFTFAPKWLALPQEGYDVEDNTNGMMAKTGGYPGGITAQTTLGTATFRAKKTGATTISGTADSLILDANNQNTVAGQQGSVQVSILAQSVEKASGVAQEPEATTTETVATSSGTEIMTTQKASALSAFDNLITFGTGSASVASLVTLVILAVIGGGVWLWRRERP